MNVSVDVKQRKLKLNELVTVVVMMVMKVVVVVMSVKFNADCGMQAYYIEKCTVRLRVP